MKKHETQSWKARVACNQAERVAHTARWVLTIDGKGAVLSVVQNKPHQLDVMAVIGPAEAGGIRYEQTVLVEIGIRRGKPYSQGKPIDSLTGKRKRIFTRQKFATIDLPRLCRMWKRLESVMVEEASGMSRVGILFQRGKQELLDGIVFTISEKDPLMLAAILQSERRMRTNPLDEDMEKAAIFLRRTLEPHNDLSFAPKRHRPCYRTEKVWT